jgi:hypothetical protein
VATLTSEEEVVVTEDKTTIAAKEENSSLDIAQEDNLMLTYNIIKTD